MSSFEREEQEVSWRSKGEQD
uniref:Uncharacterized protein n=1 Tax=Anguilla anguilla TaxID=7936 RepID=A0A0E9Q517_ANGAN